MKPPHLDDDDDEPGFFRRNLVAILFGAAAIAVGVYFLTGSKPSKSKPTRRNDVVNVGIVIPPTPPPPPPPPKEEPPPEEKEEEMIAQEEVTPEDQKPDDKPAEKPSEEPIGTAISGGDGSGLALGGNGRSNGTVIGGGGGKGGSRWGWYAGQVQNRIAEALRGNSSTRNAAATITVKVWADSTGRISRAALGSSTGNPQIDDAIKNQVLVGLVLTEPPPADMPMPINLRITARKPN